jgi:hypothetical protein
VVDILVDWIDDVGSFRPRFESNLHGCSLRFVDWHPDAAGEQHDDLIQAGDFSINSISRQMRDSGRGLAITHYRNARRDPSTDPSTKFRKFGTTDA